MARITDTTPIDLDAIGFGGVSTEFEPMPNGPYNAVFEDLELKNSKANEPYLNIKFDLTDEDGKQFSTFSLQRKALWRVKQVALRIGLDPAVWETNLSVDDIIEQFTNRSCVIMVDTQEYKPNNYIEGDPVYGKLKKRNVVTEIFGPDYVAHAAAPGSNGKSKRSRSQF